MRPSASLCPTSRYRLLTLLLVLLLASICAQTAQGSPLVPDLGNIPRFITSQQVTGGTPYSRDYRLQSRCRQHLQIMLSNNAINARGKPTSKFAVLTFESHLPGVFRIFGKTAQKYLCFSKRGRLISRQNGNSERCLFRELEQEDKYTMLQSFANERWYIGFNRRGKKMSGGRFRLHKDNPRRRQCFQFSKGRAHEDPSDIRVRHSHKKKYHLWSGADLDKAIRRQRKHGRSGVRHLRRKKLRRGRRWRTANADSVEGSRRLPDR